MQFENHPTRTPLVTVDRTDWLCPRNQYNGSSSTSVRYTETPVPNQMASGPYFDKYNDNRPMLNPMQSFSYSNMDEGASETPHGILQSMKLFCRSSWILWRDRRGKMMGITLFVISAVVLYGGYLYLKRYPPIPSANSQLTLSDSRVILKKHSDDVRDVCLQKDFASRTLKLAWEQKLFSLLGFDMGTENFEGSAIIAVDNRYYVVCDNQWNLLNISSTLKPFSNENWLVTPENRTLPIFSEDSQWEGIAYDFEDNVFFVLRESVKHVDGALLAQIQELTLNYDARTYSIQRICDTEMEFRDSNKGFEGISLLKSSTGKKYLLGLCEGNHCKGGKKGEDSGNGVLVLMEKHYFPLIAEGDHLGCIWKTVKILKIPSVTDFVDYSGIAIHGDTVAVLSQVNSQIWIGRLNLSPSRSSSKNQFFLHSPKDLDFRDSGTVFNFPRSDLCTIEYCNIEGVAFINEKMIVTVSDKMKKRKQSLECQEKDQSMQLFVLPKEI